MRPNLSVNLGVRYALQLPFYAMNSSYSTATLDDVWGISGYVPGCDLSNPTRETCNLFQPGVMTGQKPTYQNLGAGVKAYNTDWNNIAPSIGVNWTPTAKAGFLRTLLGDAGDVVALGRLQPRLRSPRHERLHRPCSATTRGCRSPATRSTANGNLTVPLLFRDGNLGPPPTCPPLPAAEADRLPAGRAGVPADRIRPRPAASTSSIRTCRSRTRIPGRSASSARSARSRRLKSATSARAAASSGRRSTTTRRTSSRTASSTSSGSRRPTCSRTSRAGCGGTGEPACSFAYRGPGTGTSPLPIYLAFFSGVPAATGRRRRRGTTSSSWTNSSFVNPLGRVQLEPVHAGGHEREQRPRRRLRRGRRTRSRPGCRRTSSA